MAKGMSADAQDRKLYQMQEDAKRGERIKYRKDILALQHFMGTDPRRRQEVMDSRMIEKDSQDMANMPREFIQDTFKREAGYLGYRLTDEDGSI